MMRAKLDRASSTAPTRSPAAIRRAIRACRRATRGRFPPTASPTCALPSAQIDGLIQTQPNNPYFHELKGQALVESGRGAEAIAPLRKAVSLAPSSNLIRALLAQALVSTNDRRQADEAIAILRDVLIHEKELVSGYRQLAMAYGQKGDLAQADLASAQASFAAGDFKTARELAARAKTRLPTGSPGWVKADDIATYRPRRRSQLTGGSVDGAVSWQSAANTAIRATRDRSEETTHDFA